VRLIVTGNFDENAIVQDMPLSPQSLRKAAAADKQAFSQFKIINATSEEAQCFLEFEEVK
jgi:hypothetical protein